MEWLSTLVRATERTSGPALEQVEAELRGLEAVPDALAASPVAGLADEVAPWTGKLARAAAVAHGALTGGDRAALTAQLAELRADKTEIGEPLLEFAEGLLRAQPAAAGRG